MKRLLGVLKIFRRDLIVLAITFFRRETPMRIRVLCLMAAAYLISPVDILPDAVPLAGVIDDAVIVPGAVYGILNLLPENFRKESEKKADRWLRNTIIVGAVATGGILLWLGLIVVGIYWFIAK